MLINVVLFGIFLLSIGLTGYLIFLKIPELVAIPDEVIDKRLHENSARFRVWLLNIRTYFKESRHKEFVANILGKILYRIHIALLKFDNRLVFFIKKVRHNGKAHLNGGISASVFKKEYWYKLKNKIE